MHDHHHEEDSYYLDQLCTVTMSAAFGGVCLALYFWKTDMLTRLLGPQFHLFVAISGFTLLGLALLRAYSLWTQAAHASGHTHEHVHDGHAHDHGHEHGPEGHHEHTHTHAHSHHDHAPGDHSHDWAPWRYVVLMLPVALFLLGLPNKGPKAQAEDAAFIRAESEREAKEAIALLAPGSAPWSQLIYAAYLGSDPTKGDAEDWDFRNLSPKVAADARSADSNDRERWKNKNVRVIGMYSPSPQSDREFRLVRFKLTCCVADAVQLNLPIVARESIQGIKANSWVRVIGRVEFRKRRDEIVPIIVVAKGKDVQSWIEDPNPYN